MPSSGRAAGLEGAVVLGCSWQQPREEISLHRSEGFGREMAEALQLGVDVIATDTDATGGGMAVGDGGGS